jgi:multicomponent Na+:H+ antiporter subunit F
MHGLQPRRVDGAAAAGPSPPSLAAGVLRLSSTVTAFLLALAVFLLLNLLGGLVRVLRGPTAGDRMLAAMLFGSTGVALLLVLSEALAFPALRNVALVFSVLAAVNAVAFVRSRWRSAGATPP